MKRDQRFPIMMTKREREALDCLAEQERLSAAAVVRRLIWREAERRDLVSPPGEEGSKPSDRYVCEG
jgi:hypothetical protein